LGTIYKLAVVLTKSQLRGTQRSKLLARIVANPRIVLLIDAILLLALGALGYALLSMNSIGGFREMIRGAEAQGLAGVPTAIAFSVIVLGVLYEISQPVQSMSTDLVNWLPISPTEYVAGSVISESYIYSFMLSMFLGALLGPAIYFGLNGVWVAAALMTVTALLLASCVVEILDALTNRISSSFYKRSGRSGIMFRLVFTIIILVFFQLMFSGQIAFYVLQSLVRTVSAVWYVPVVWPSVSVLSLAQGRIVDSMVFGALSTGFTLLLFAVAAGFRARFWVPVPVSIKLTSQTYRPGTSLIRVPGIGAVESALIRKDFRSIFRRREMARFLAIPFVLAVSMGVSLYGTRSSADSLGLIAVFPLFVIPVTIFTEMLAMTSIGQEGAAVWNLYAAPIRPGELLRAKLIYATALSAIFAAAMALVFGILVTEVMSHVWVLVILGIALALEQAAIGMSIGARFPDFRETIRSRYVGVWGSLLGVFLGGFVIGMLTISPVFFSVLFYPRLLDQFALVSFALGLVIFILAWRIAERQIEALLSNIRV
jgi:hypothetical protein